MSLRSFASVATLSFLLTSCGHMPVSTMVQLRNFDFATFDPAEMRAGLRFPDVLVLRANGLKLVVDLEHQGPVPDKRKEVFHLKDTSEAALGSELLPWQKKGMRVMGYRIDAGDVARIRSLQELGQKWKREGTQNKDKLTISFEPDVCRRDALPETPLYVTTFLKVDARSQLVVFLKDVDLRKIADEAGKPLDENVPPCERFTNRAE
jgi:hypothetical protein